MNWFKKPTPEGEFDRVNRMIRNVELQRYSIIFVRVQYDEICDQYLEKVLRIDVCFPQSN